MLLSVILPVYNEHTTLGLVLANVSHALPTVPKEVIVVEDCSIDGTREWLERNIPQGVKSGSGFELDADGNLVPQSSSTAASVIIRSVYHE